MSDLHKMKNIGKVNERKLINAGVLNAEQLCNVGSKKAFELIQEKVDEGACLNLLYALEAAILGIEKTYLDNEIKQDLKNYFNCK